MPLSRQTTALLFGVTFTSLLAYWGGLLYVGVWQNEETVPDVGGLARYLLGIGLLLAGLGAVAHLNYRLAFQRWLLRRETGLVYWTWLCGLAWLLFELLQVRTDHVPDFIDENLLVTAVLLAVIMAYGYVADSFRTRRAQDQLLQQKIEAELTALKAQVNPHFLFNALNTIYNEAQRADNETVADLIQQLAGIMRFTLQESKQPLTSIENEFSFLEKYLALQRARLPERDTLRVSTQLEWDGQPAPIAPLLLIPFVENAYQYGLSFVQPSYIDLRVVVENHRLRMHVANSVAPAAATRLGPGTGIATARQRLALMYANRHELLIQQTVDSFTVSLTLDL
ncbi:sensor histidine kinase [Hymenobacter volaticus]|uniref:Sensor histidine kinase n=1 Tax=Hymenobacter volaticus TaxID=2932254 RepID=A0ABY4GEJ2_9BACT|nr:sensor histidine kinase [Hymenobacter volaticus]UOQ68959.1 sensor histidine kinase [Hymenobacter volaticus]